jgi:ABC-type polysaccharide/polyol phosphate export permease
MASRADLFRHFVRQELKRRYLGTLGSASWALLHPLVQFAIYATVFAVIFAARVPERPDLPFGAWLAVALWPWFAFSEAIHRAAAIIPDHAALIGKVALPIELLPQAAVAASFILHGLGYLAVLVVLAAMGYPLSSWGFLLAPPLLVVLYALALGIAFLVSSLSVFLRDVAQITAQLLMLAFFLTPIFYARGMLPEQWQWALDCNPLTAVVEGLRHAWLGTPPPTAQGLALALAASASSLYFGRRLFRRTAGHFHDYL